MVHCCHSENVAALAALAALATLAALAALIGTAFKSAVFSKAAFVIPLVVGPLTATLQALQPLHTFHPLRWGKSVKVNAIHAVVGIPTAALHVAVTAVTAIAAVVAVARLFTAPVGAVSAVIAIASSQLVGVVVTTKATWSWFSW